MNETPRNNDPSDEVDELYRRAAALDGSRPSEPVRQAVLAHATKLAQEHRARNATTKIGSARRKAQSIWWRPAIFGTLAAAAIAGLLVTPQFLPPRAPDTAALQKSEDAKTFGARRDAVATRAPAESELSQLAQMRAKEQSSASPAPGPALEPALTPAPTPFPQQAPASVAAAAPAPASAAPPAAMLAQRQSMAKAQASADNAAALADSSKDKMSSNAPAAQLRQAAEAGDLAELQSIIDKRADIESRDARGRTALMLATLHGQTRSVDALLAAGADPNAADARGVTPLQAAVAGGKTGIAAALRRAGAR